MKIAIAQLNPIIGDISGNAKLILEAAQKAQSLDTKLMITPELSLIGYPPRDLLIYPSLIEAAGVELEGLAKDLPSEIAVLVGTVTFNSQAAEKGEKSLFNSAALLTNGKVKQIFHKRLLPTYDVFDEDRYFEPGKTSDFFTLEVSPNSSESSAKVGVTICEDLWNDAEFWGKRNYTCDPMKELAEQQVDFVVNMSASPYRVGKQKLREAMLEHSTNRYQIPIIYVNQVGGNDDLIFDGCSVVFNSAGNVIYRAKAFETSKAVVEFNSAKKDLTSVNFESINLPESEDEEIWSALVLGVKDYVRKCGFSKVVLGLSGGIDSALVAAIATAALGKENVFAILMPSPYSSDHSVKDALELVENLGIAKQLISIGDLMKGYDNSLADLFAGTNFGIAEENIQSRIRGNLLMAISNKFGNLLLSTGNKSEMAVGYCTLYGDMNGGLAVISDVPKTRVYSLCQWLNQQAVNINQKFFGSENLLITQKQNIIPENILTKAPSAELKEDQKDQDSLPDYEVLDDILFRLVENCESLAEIIAAGHDSEVVNKVLKLVMRAEFKRRQAPPGLKISERAFGTGWRMPIAKKLTINN
ncbi:MAG: NAD+ synthase [Okeania sp. SIO2F4]|uniref:NAD+ synthase n=1 Tax=Okeania sp. SIO2F4 TaxID=2607790 RepID=UPI00142A83B3|nr:NAD+ synthase [Okeania sp. SIO2F4]NES02296.1 NAD+ synthase [Okeania sp. SIO2F4]